MKQDLAYKYFGKLFQKIKAMQFVKLKNTKAWTYTWPQDFSRFDNKWFWRGWLSFWGRNLINTNLFVWGFHSIFVPYWSGIPHVVCWLVGCWLVRLKSPGKFCSYRANCVLVAGIKDHHDLMLIECVYNLIKNDWLAANLMQGKIYSTWVRVCTVNVAAWQSEVSSLARVSR